MKITSIFIGLAGGDVGQGVASMKQAQSAMG
jgi:hypothetical protein